MKHKTSNDRNPIRPLLDQVNGAVPPRGYRTTPTSRNGSGHHADSKPTDGPAQWMLQPGGKLPWRAFEPHPKERERFWSMAHCVPLNGTEVEQVKRIGGQIFDASLGAPATKFESEIAIGQLEIDRLDAERRRIERDAHAAGVDLEDLPSTIQQETTEPRFPPCFSVKWWALVGFLVLILLSSGAAVLLIGKLLLPIVDSWLFASVAACPFVLTSIAVETFVLLSLKTDSLKVARVLRGSLIVVVLGVVLWLVGIFTLAAPLDLSANTVLAPDRRLAVAGQLVCDLGVSFLLINGLLKTLAHRRITVPNQNRIAISGHISSLSDELYRVIRSMDSVKTQVSNATGNLREWQNSRGAFIDEGLSILNLRASEAALITELQRQHGEKQKLLSRFTPNHR